MILCVIVEQGFRRIVLWRGCGGHDLHQMVERFNQVHARTVQVFLPPHPYHAIWCRLADPSIPGGHADSFTTSISLYLRPHTVRLDRLSNPHSSNVDWNNPHLDFAQHSSTGVIGDPTHASAELGERLWAAVVAEAAQTLMQIAQEPGLAF